jgi:hypothetical protein
MSNIISVTFGDGDLAEQLYQLKVSALRNNDTPALWRLTDKLIELVVATVRSEHQDRWPRGYVSETRLFDVPVDYVHDLPHLLCEDYIIYPYTVRPPQVWHA